MKTTTYDKVEDLIEGLGHTDLQETLVNDPNVLVIDNRQLVARIKDLEIAVEKLESILNVSEFTE